MRQGMETAIGLGYAYPGDRSSAGDPDSGDRPCGGRNRERLSHVGHGAGTTWLVSAQLFATQSAVSAQKRTGRAEVGHSESEAPTPKGKKACRIPPAG